MNIFYLHHNTKLCAEMHVDRHVTKMCIEYAQLMSTAHRLLDGVSYLDKTSNGRSIQRWKLEGDNEIIMMKASHINHPSAIWTRKNEENYIWLYTMWSYLCEEYTHRYGKIHAVETRMHNVLKNSPTNIPKNLPFTEPTPAMPDEYKVAGNSTQSYINYYLGAKTSMFSWKNRNVPDFCINILPT